MASATDARVCFLVDWFDPHAQLARDYWLFFYLCDQSIEMYDIKARRTFLKRTVSPLTLGDLHLHASITVFSRQLTLKDYGDAFTRNMLASQLESVAAVVLPAAVEAGRTGDVLDALVAEGFVVRRCRMVQVDREAAEALVDEGEDAGRRAESLCGPRVLGLELSKPSAHGALTGVARTSATLKSNLYVPSTVTASTRLLAQLFPAAAAATGSATSFAHPPAGARLPTSTQLSSSTLALLKPHAFRAGQLGSVLAAIEKGGFRVVGCRSFELEKVDVEEFLEVYKGVVNEYYLMLEELTAGTLVALEITRSPTASGAPSPVHIVTAFRDFVGPVDPEIARQLRPNSLRARFGQDKIKNALHCTDLEEDGEMEVRYFFNILGQ